MLAENSELVGTRITVLSRQQVMTHSPLASVRDLTERAMSFDGSMLFFSILRKLPIFPIFWEKTVDPIFSRDILYSWFKNILL